MMERGTYGSTVYAENGAKAGQSRGNDGQPPGCSEREEQPGEPLDPTVEYGSGCDGLRPNDTIIDIAKTLFEKLERYDPNSSYMIGVAQCLDGTIVVARSGNNNHGEFEKTVPSAIPGAKIALAIVKNKNGERIFKNFTRIGTWKCQLQNAKDYGDCAAPKILAWAHSQQSQSVGARRTPIALVEMWFDPSGHDKTVSYGHGEIIGPCKHCQELLPRMLAGRAAAEAEGAKLIEADQKRARGLAAAREHQRKQRVRNAQRKARERLKDKSATIEKSLSWQQEWDLLKRWQIFVERKDDHMVEKACDELLFDLRRNHGDRFLEIAKDYTGDIDVGTEESEEQESEEQESEEQESEEQENGDANTGKNVQPKGRKRRRNRRKRSTLTRIALFVVVAFVMTAVVLIVFASFSGLVG